MIELTLLAQRWGWVDLAIALVIFVIVAGIVLIVCKVAGWSLPPWVFQIIGLLALGVVAVWAIRFIASM